MNGNKSKITLMLPPILKRRSFWGIKFKTESLLTIFTVQPSQVYGNSISENAPEMQKFDPRRFMKFGGIQNLVARAAPVLLE